MPNTFLRTEQEKSRGKVIGLAKVTFAKLLAKKLPAEKARAMVYQATGVLI